MFPSTARLIRYYARTFRTFQVGIVVCVNVEIIHIFFAAG